MNFDGVIFCGLKALGVGVIIVRDHESKFVARLSKRFQDLRSIDVVELKAAIERVLIFNHLILNNCIIESILSGC